MKEKSDRAEWRGDLPQDRGGQGRPWGPEQCRGHHVPQPAEPGYAQHREEGRWQGTASGSGREREKRIRNILLFLAEIRLNSLEKQNLCFVLEVCFGGMAWGWNSRLIHSSVQVHSPVRIQGPLSGCSGSVLMLRGKAEPCSHITEFSQSSLTFCAWRKHSINTGPKPLQKYKWSSFGV